MFKTILQSKRLAQAAGQVRADQVVRLTGVWGCSAPALIAGLGITRKATVLVVCTHLDDADAIADDLEVLSGRAAEQFPAYEISAGAVDEELLGAADHVTDEISGQRLRVCSLLAEPPGLRDEPLDFIVASVGALLQPVPSPQVLAGSRLSLRKGIELGIDTLHQWLVDAGFERVDTVDQAGEFASRGGIVDIFPPGVNQPVRVEFFGDQVESLRKFDLDTQRSTQDIDGYDIVATSAARQTQPERTTSLISYLPPDAVVCIVEPTDVATLAATFARRTQSGTLIPWDDIARATARLGRVEMYAFGPESPEPGVRTIAMGIRSIQRLEVNTAEALDELDALSQKNRVCVYCENPAEKGRFLDLLRSGHPDLAKRIETPIGHISRGFYWPAEKLVVAAHHEIFHRYARPVRLRRVRTGRPIDSFVDLQDGDYVVHVAHGIARFEGLRTLEKEGRKEEYLTLRFADSALLHVPVSQIQLVQKYVGARRGHPTLSHLGGTGWSQRKARVTEAVEDMAAELLRVQAIRAHAPGVSYKGDSEWMRQFEEEFVYEETEDQLTAMKQIGSDLAQDRPMDRLLCGDVGFGKTELAMRAAFRVAEAGRQVAVLVPTTVLAAQHFRTFRERFADYPFSIDVISRFRTGHEQNDIIRRAKSGQIDILIGTHRILSDDVELPNLGLVVVDEEQRFGVEHKERLKKMRQTVEVLTLTATPIPRTLHMALLGLRDISNLATPPMDRRAIRTEICTPADERIRAAILRELNRGGQVFFVHNRVFNIESTADHIRRLVPEARVDIGHGQMPERALEKTMLRFVRGEIDVLVCTTIIESGLDIPTANTMLINDSDRLGLAELHQLRGRIGRCKHRAYCYLLLPKTRPVSRVAAKRLKAVEEFSDLGAGFKIAMRDLEIRGAGNILGPEQSGHIAAVGYEMYCQLLEVAVRQLRGEKVQPRREVHVELGADAYIPRAYISSGRQRMEVYRRLATCQSPEELSQLSKDLDDAFGPIPPMVDCLVTLAEIRVLAGGMGIHRIVLMPPDVVFSVDKATQAGSLFKHLPGTVRAADPTTAHWRPGESYLQHLTLLVVLRKHLRQAAGRV